MKNGNWVPLDKNLVSTLPQDRSFSAIEAMFSYTVDQDNGKEGSINGYSNLWGWSRNKVRKFISELRTGRGHIADRKGTGKGHLIRFIDTGSQVVKDRKGTGKGQVRDRKGDTTIYPDPKPDKKKGESKRFFPPLIEEVRAYCEERKNGIDPKAWMNHYQSKGWMIGKNKMKDWKAAVRTWEAGNNRPGGMW